MIRFRTIKLEEFPDEISDYESFLDDCPAIHIEYIAIDERYQKHQIGTNVMNIVIKQIQKFASVWPVRVITLDAISDKVFWYKRLGFQEIYTNGIYFEGYTIPMFLDCLLSPDTLDTYVDKMNEV